MTGDGVEKDELGLSAVARLVISITPREIKWDRSDEKIDNGDEFDTTINNVAITDSTGPYIHSARRLMVQKLRTQILLKSPLSELAKMSTSTS